MDNEKKIEIPFGAFDSELIHQEINIPKGFKATIEGDKIILTRAGGEDEKVRKALIEMVHDTTGDELWVDYNVHKEEALAWLEKQGESYTKRDVDDAWLKGMCDAKRELEKQAEEKGIRKAFNKIEDEKQGEQKPQRMISAEAKEAMYDKPTWSEEDEEMFDGIIADIQFSQKAHNHEVDQIVYEREIDWLKSLKERIGG